MGYKRLQSEVFISSIEGLSGLLVFKGVQDFLRDFEGFQAVLSDIRCFQGISMEVKAFQGNST